MANFDFKNAQLPQLLPLKNSFTQNEVEAEVKQLTLDLFAASLAEDVFDVNVLGAAHLGSFELVRRSINSDGLVLLQGDREEDATRYLFRAWKSRNNQGRGLHFLRTYLQLLFPNICNVYQCWQDKKVQYPTSLHENIPQGRDKNDFFLTSRVEISLTLDVQIQSLKGLRDIIRSVVPARIVPGFRFIIIFELAVKPYVDYFFDKIRFSISRSTVTVCTSRILRSINSSSTIAILNYCPLAWLRRHWTAPRKTISIWQKSHVWISSIWRLTVRGMSRITVPIFAKEK